MITLLVPPANFEHEQCEVSGDAYRHLFRARRLAAGVRLRLVDGCGRARWAEVRRVERRRAILDLGEAAPDNEPDYRLHLLVAALRPERASWLVEKATELGVRSISFIATARTPRRYGSASLERWRRVASAAVEQSHRSRLPEIRGVETWESAIAFLRRDGAEVDDRYYLDVGPRGSLDSSQHGSSGAVWVGPEGGWSHEEAGELERLGCRAVSLGPRILRVETAAVAASALLLIPVLTC